jgi:catechol 2,3-dioxygenase-like lactoylglutathione lyase family enzyme
MSSAAVDDPDLMSDDEPILTTASVTTRLPAQDLERARRWYRDKLGLEPVETREGGLLYRTAEGAFALFASAGAPSGDHTQMAWEVADLRAAMTEMQRHGVIFNQESIPGLPMIDGIVDVGGNYPSKGRSELAAWFRDSEGNVHGIGQPVGGAAD